jgi:hypothetical protein
LIEVGAFVPLMSLAESRVPGISRAVAPDVFRAQPARWRGPPAERSDTMILLALLLVLTLVAVLALRYGADSRHAADQNWW